MQTYWPKVAALCAVTLVGGCAKKSSSPAPASESVTTQVTDYALTGGNATFHYKSNLATASFKCMASASGQAAPAWQDCPVAGQTVPVPAGVTVNFTVKAFDPSTNVEDPAPPTIAVTGGVANPTGIVGPSGPGGPSGPSGFATVILNKSDATNPYNKTSLQVSFGTTGGGQINNDHLSYLCKRETDTAFRLCDSPNGKGGDSYDFGTLVNGTTYTLEVEALDNDNNQTATEDRITFKVAMTTLTVNGSAALANKTGAVNLTWDPTQTQGDKVSCAVDQGQPVDCTTGWSGNLSTMPAGSHALTITCAGATGAIVASTVENFCAQNCSQPTGPVAPSGTTPGTPPPPVVQIMQLGSFYQFTVPLTMHVTEYATTKDMHNNLQFYRIMNDPYYLGNYGCNGTTDSRITAAQPTANASSPDSFDYCLSTPPINLGGMDFYKWLTNGDLAYNHLEVATDPELVSNENQDYIDFNVFDAQVEYMYGRSRFEQLCLNQHGAISKASGVDFLNHGSFFGASVNADFYMCTTDLVEPTGPGLPSRDPTMWRNTWWVGAFFITGSGTALPQYECITQTPETYGGAQHPYNAQFCGTYQNPSLLEMTMVSHTPYPTAAEFARDAMLKVQNNILEIQPIIVTTGN